MDVVGNFRSKVRIAERKNANLGDLKCPKITKKRIEKEFPGELFSQGKCAVTAGGATSGK
jgi:hypothetical protein